MVTYEASSPAELQQEFEAAVDDYLETCAELKRTPQRALRGLFNVRVPPALHKAAALRAVRDDASLNEVVVKALDAYLCSKSEVNHSVKVTFETNESVAMQTVAKSVSDETTWGKVNVH